MPRQRKSKAKTITVKFDDQEHKLPIISKGRNLATEDKITIAQLVCEMYATDRYPLTECLKACGINSESTWFNWLQIEEIEELYKESQRLKTQIYKHKLRERLRTAFEKNIDGYTVTATDRLGELVNVVENGQQRQQLRTTHFRQKEVVIRPSARLIEFGLINIDGMNFTRDPEPYKAGNSNIPTSIGIEIINEYLPPVTNEDDIEDYFGD